MCIKSKASILFYKELHSFRMCVQQYICLSITTLTKGSIGATLWSDSPLRMLYHYLSTISNIEVSDVSIDVSKHELPYYANSLVVSTGLSDCLLGFHNQTIRGYIGRTLNQPLNLSNTKTITTNSLIRCVQSLLFLGIYLHSG